MPRCLPALPVARPLVKCQLLASELYGRHTEDGNIVDVAISPSEYQRVGWEVSALAVSHRMSLLRRGPEIVP